MPSWRRCRPRRPDEGPSNVAAAGQANGIGTGNGDDYPGEAEGARQRLAEAARVAESWPRVAIPTSTFRGSATRRGNVLTHSEPVLCAVTRWLVHGQPFPALCESRHGRAMLIRRHHRWAGCRHSHPSELLHLRPGTWLQRILPSLVARELVAALATSPKNTDPGVVGHGVAGWRDVGGAITGEVEDTRIGRHARGLRDSRSVRRAVAAACSADVQEPSTWFARATAHRP